MGRREVSYLELPNGKKLISYHRHDYKAVTIEGDYYSIDGGQDGYLKISTPPYIPTFSEKLLAYLKIKPINYYPELKKCSLRDCLHQAREEFEWGSQYDKNGTWLGKTVYKKLKDLETDHIETLVDEFVQGFVRELMIEELEFRKEVSNYIKKN